jgi:CHAD domain-containing protein
MRLNVKTIRDDIMNIPHSDQAKTFGDWAYLAIAQHFNKILKHEAGVLKDQDPEELHQMRVGMRRFRSVVTGFDAALILPEAGGEKQVGKMARLLGSLRDLDVLQETLQQQYQPSLTHHEQKELKVIYRKLKQRRKRVFKRVELLLTRESYQDFKKAIKHWLKEPQYQPISQVNIREILPDLLSPQISYLLLHPGWLIGVNFAGDQVEYRENLTREFVAEILATEGDILHDLRKEAKKTRYNMDLFTRFYGEEYSSYLQDVKQIQTVLGEIQDSSVLADFLVKSCHCDLDNKLPSLVTRLQEIRYENWQQWEVLQRKFLDFERRNNLRLTIQNPIL